MILRSTRLQSRSHRIQTATCIVALNSSPIKNLSFAALGAQCDTVNNVAQVADGTAPAKEAAAEAVKEAGGHCPCDSKEAS